MQTSIRNLSETALHPDYRWDSEYLCFEPYKNKALKYVPISDVLISSQYGLSVDMNEEGNGTKIYRMNEISNMVCARNILKYSKISQEQIEIHKLKDRDILFNRTNSQNFVGRTGIFKKFSNEDIVFASYLIRVNPDTDIVTPEYLTAFLNTKYGILDVKRRARISINQSNVNAEELKRVEIPLVSNDFQLEITTAFDNAFKNIQESEKKYQEAQTILLSELGLLEWKPKHQQCYIKNYSDIEQAGRMDAEYYQPKYEEIEQAIEDYSGGYSSIKNEFVQNESTFIVEDEKLYQYVEIGSVNISNGEITLSRVVGSELPANAKRVLNKDDVIISKVRTYRGAITIVEENGHVGSGAFTVLRENGRINKETLLTFLHSEPLLAWSLKPNTGTSYPVITDNDVLNLSIPLLPEEKQIQIRQNIIASFNHRKQSKYLLEGAKRAVEIAI